jgi:thymidylate synthase (FAD)
MENFQVLAAERAGIDDEGRDFHYKKEVTSDMRRFAPLGLLTGMVWSANLRTLRQTIEARTAPGAEREIRDLFHRVGLIMIEEAPSIFADFRQEKIEGSDTPAWVTDRSKV